MNKRKTSAFVAAGLAGLAVPIAMGTDAVGQQQTVTTCPEGVTAPSPYCSVTTVGGTTGTQPGGTTGTAPSGNTGTQTTPGGSSNSGNKVKPRGLKLGKLPKGSRPVPGRFVVRGTLTPANGLRCNGRVTVGVLQGKRIVGRQTVPVPSSCKFTARPKVKRSKVKGKRGTLTVKARYRGSNTMHAISAKTKKIRFRK